MKSSGISSIGVLSLALLAATTGCSTFHRDWKAAAAKPVPEAGIEGAWDGTWRSGKNGHTGDLRALVTRRTISVYETRFHATFWGVFSGGYTVNLTAFPKGDEYSFRGSADLGDFLCWSLGEYACHGTSTTGSFSAHYTNRYDFGTFELKRPE